MTDLRRIVVETPCEHGVSGPCGIVTGYPTEPVTLEECGGGDTRIIDPGNLPAEVIEAAAINRAHFDGIDYGEPYEQWPASFEEDGEPWDAEEAKEFYRDQARSALSAAFRTLGGGE